MDETDCSPLLPVCGLRFRLLPTRRFRARCQAGMFGFPARCGLAGRNGEDQYQDITRRGEHLHLVLLPGDRALAMAGWGSGPYNWGRISISTIRSRRSMRTTPSLSPATRQSPPPGSHAEDGNGAPTPIKMIFSSHHTLFFNVLCNEIENRPKANSRSPTSATSCTARCDGAYTLHATETRRFSTMSPLWPNLKLAADPQGKALHSPLQHPAEHYGEDSFLLRHRAWPFCLKTLDNEEDRALFNRALTS